MEEDRETDKIVEDMIDHIRRRAFSYSEVYRTLIELGERFDLSSNLKPFKSEDKIRLKDFRRGKGMVYFLYDKEELVYIGTTWGLPSRIQYHLQQGKKFDSLAFFECDFLNGMIDNHDLEILLLEFYKTKYNKKLGRKSEVQHNVKS